ncbi:putative ATP-dependent RNA helicase DDX4 [Oryzias melastigma]|uniref:RNA helicase n=1 Tax=Oryzias melastigma TaxID=30732 RepID=A0A834F820_ORYME|nr:putative ATP-dependent RNA helicase DDX4 [Oryzias melastigma]
MSAGLSAELCGEEVFFTQFPVHRACRDGDVAALVPLLQQLSNRAPLTAEDSYYGWTPIHWAAHYGRLECVVLLVQMGCEVNTPTSRFNQTPTHTAAFGGHPHCLVWLTQAGADINKQDCVGEAPIHKAARSGSLDCVQVLLIAGAEPHLRNANGQTAADLAHANGFHDCFCFISKAQTRLGHLRELHAHRVQGDDRAPGSQRPLGRKRQQNSVEGRHVKKAKRADGALEQMQSSAGEEEEEEEGMNLEQSSDQTDKMDDWEEEGTTPSFTPASSTNEAPQRNFWNGDAGDSGKNGDTWNQSSRGRGGFGRGGRGGRGRGFRRSDQDELNGDDGDRGDSENGFRGRGRGGRGGGFRSGGEQRGRGGGGYRGRDEDILTAAGDSGGAENKDGADGERPKVTYIPPSLPEDEDSIFSQYKMGINFDKYDDILVDVSGTNLPPAILTFEEAKLCESLKNNISRSGYVKPTPVQKYGLPIISAGRDLMACAQTGSGKTAAFLLPILQQLMADGVAASRFSEIQEPEAVIVAPTRELINQIFQEARKFAFGTCVRPVVVYGGVNTGYQMREIQKGCNVLCGTPGRLLDMIGRGKVGMSKVRHLVLDEADRMLDMGFEPDMRRLVASPGMPPKEERQTLMFSATFPEDIQRSATPT